MKLFKSKAEKEAERRMLVKQSMKELEKRIRKLKEQEAVYIRAAKAAQQENLPKQIQLAKDALKMTVSERKRTMEMLLNAQIISQMRDMSAMTGEFLKAVHNISKSIAGSTSQDVNKISSELKIAMGKVENQTENLADMLENAQDDLSDYSEETSASVSDEEIDQLIYGAGGASAGGALSIDDELAALQRELNK
jgi:methionine synthase II (cobalamin-independent)